MVNWLARSLADCPFDRRFHRIVTRVISAAAAPPATSPARQSGLQDAWRAIGATACQLEWVEHTGSTNADVVASQVGNVHHPQYPGIEDFGDVMLRGDGGAGYIRVDWFTPDGLSTWGDGRLTVLGTEGFIEIRKNVDIGGRPGANHLFLVDQKETRYVDAGQQDLPYGTQLVDDVLNRTETAVPQAHTFLAMELALKAEAQAKRVDVKPT